LGEHPDPAAFSAVLIVDQSLRVNTALKKGENETAAVGWINMLKKGHYELT
jgi:hypothetical protein